MHARVKKSATFFCGAVCLIAAVFFVNGANAQSEVKLSQQIMPVKVAYVGENGKISGIWSNVSVFDDAYVIKFYNKKSKEEISPDNLLIEEFVQIYQEKERQNLQQSFGRNERQSRSVNVVMNSGNVVQEVETVV